MNLWVFGDSYAEIFKSLNDQWANIIAKELGANIKSYGLAGSSVEYTYKKFNLVRDDINKGDIIIIALTTHSRRWLLKNYPGQTSTPDVENKGYTFSVVSPTNNAEEQEAINLYYQFLNHNNLLKNVVNETHLTNFLYCLDYITKKKNLTTIILINFFDTNEWIEDKKECFPNLYFAKDMMLLISLNELTKKAMVSLDTSTQDLRVNHLIKSNHLILANKILSYIRNKTPIDLSEGFVKHVLDQKKLKDPSFIETELFWGYMFRARMKL